MIHLSVMLQTIASVAYVMCFTSSLCIIRKIAAVYYSTNCISCHGCAIQFQAFWYLEWHLDLLILWALGCTGEYAKAEDLLEGLKSRLGA